MTIFMLHKTLRLFVSLGFFPLVLNCSIPILASAQLVSSDKRFPSSAPIVNIQAAPYFAKGDGINDDTQAILQAIKDNIEFRNRKRVIYFPKGIYLVTNTLEWKNKAGAWQNFLTFQGENQAGINATIIKLKDNAPGYQNPNIPKAVIFTAGPGDSNPSRGSGDGQRNYIFDLTVDTGKGNPGAIGIDYRANNLGAIRNVTIRSTDPAYIGKVGLNMTRGWPGPCLIKNVKIVGFDVGIDVKGFEYSATLEYIALEKQKVAGIRNMSNVLSIRKLTSNNSVPAIKQDIPSTGPRNGSLTVLIDAQLKGGSIQNVAIDNGVGNNVGGNIFLRTVTTTGYQAAVKDRGVIVPGANISEYVSAPPVSLFNSTKKSLNLSIKETPTFHDNNTNAWINVTDTKFGAKPDDDLDDTAAIQKAIDSSDSVRATLYFPSGSYNINKTLILRNRLRKIVGFSASLKSNDNGFFSNPNNPQPVLRVSDGIPQIVFIDGLNIVKGEGNNSGSIGIEQATARTLVIQDSQLATAISYRGIPGAGKLFLEDVIGPKYQFSTAQEVWARHLNPEINDWRIRNNGATLWILGLKTENFGATPVNPTVIETTNGGSTELLGGLIYPSRTTPISVPAFIIRDSKVSLSYAVSAYNGSDRNYNIQVQETRLGRTVNLTTGYLLNIVNELRTKIYARGEYGLVMPLYSGETP
jgi:hypothetical protein